MLLFDLVLSQRSKMAKVSLFSISPIPPLLKSCLSQGYSNSDTPFSVTGDTDMKNKYEPETSE